MNGGGSSLDSSASNPGEAVTLSGFGLSRAGTEKVNGDAFHGPLPF